MPSKVDDLVLRIEAVLFASGKPQSVHELTEALEAPDHRPVQRALRRLVRTYGSRQTALEVRRVGDRFALQLREEFVPSARPVTPLDMAPRTIKALTLIAYHQPILQSLLVRMLGDSAYDEVERLRTLGLIQADPKGATLELRTTRRFAEHFGLASAKPEDIRQLLEKRLGVAPPPPTLEPEPPASPEPLADAPMAPPPAS